MRWRVPRRGVFEGPPRALYRRSRARYFDASAAGVVANGIVVSGFGVVALALYVDLRPGELALFAACSAAAFALSRKPIRSSYPPSRLPSTPLPLRSPPPLAASRTRRAVREKGLAVALSGQGGDEVFGGYRSFTGVPRWQRRMAALRLVPSGSSRRQFAGSRSDWASARTASAPAANDA